MRQAVAVFLWLLLTLGNVSAQDGSQGTATRTLPNWLTGIIAVAVFLFLVFVAFLVNKAWCETPSRESKAEPVKTNEYSMTNGTHYDTTLDMVRSNENENAYENVTIQDSDEKVTAM
ncbi:PDZK1-interacting protein 1 [Megalops cyprinoides]|uniref:PDZK1-interacting protein 1 n=1 Tax=Megalops cyprinoides TaxID=118141 RepID=UPI0018644F46|nr:PDZK1-interacting protein 1 [Megalops cyprinoides]